MKLCRLLLLLFLLVLQVEWGSPMLRSVVQRTLRASLISPIKSPLQPFSRRYSIQSSPPPAPLGGSGSRPPSSSSKKESRKGKIKQEGKKTSIPRFWDKYTASSHDADGYGKVSIDVGEGENKVTLTAYVKYAPGEDFPYVKFGGKTIRLYTGGLKTKYGMQVAHAKVAEKEFKASERKNKVLHHHGEVIWDEAAQDYYVEGEMVTEELHVAFTKHLGLHKLVQKVHQEEANKINPDMKVIGSQHTEAYSQAHKIDRKTIQANKSK